MATCIRWDDELGYPIFVCVRGQRKQECAECGGWAVVLCDAPLSRPVFGEPSPEACDRPLCRDHARHIGPNWDTCLTTSCRAIHLVVEEMATALAMPAEDVESHVRDVMEVYR